MSRFTIILPSLVQRHIILKSLSVQLASMFSLTVTSITLIFSRLVDMYSGRRIYIYGLVQLIVQSLVISFTRNKILLDLSQAFQGISVLVILPLGLILIERIYRPRKRKNIVFSIYRAYIPFGFLSLFISKVRRIEASYKNR